MSSCVVSSGGESGTSSFAMACSSADGLRFSSMMFTSSRRGARRVERGRHGARSELRRAGGVLGRGEASRDACGRRNTTSEHRVGQGGSKVHVVQRTPTNVIEQQR